MEVKEIEGHKYRKIGKGDEEEDGEVKRRSNGSTGGGGGLVVVGAGGTGGGGLDFRSAGRLCGWPSSRIVRVSRASGGKDRHSKVWTSKGLRDRRVRLSVNTAIQFYDLQDRLGYDQPSKAVEWLLKAAASSISELPSINTSFPDSPKLLLTDEKTLLDSPKPDPNYPTQTGGALHKSGCSDNSDENSKGSGGGLSLSRSESRFKARERARERSAREKVDKDKENESNIVFHQDHLSENLNTQISQNAASFTELLTSGMNGNNNNNTTTPNGSASDQSTRIYSSPMDYFASTGQIHLGNPIQQALSSPMFTFTGDHHQEPHQFSFVPDHFVPVVTTAAGNNGGNTNDYNLNFTISSASGLAGYSRGTLQSNSSTPSILSHIQRFPFIDGSPSFFIGAAATPVENNHQQILPGFDARLQLYYGDGNRHSDQKGKGKD